MKTDSRVGQPSVLRQLAKAFLALSLGRRRLLVAGTADSGSVCLTFDDGPHPEHTPRVLDALGEAGIPATFFVVGSQAEQHPGLVTRIVQEGHTLGHHSWSHGEPSQTSAGELMSEVARTRDLLQRNWGVQAQLFRPPKGKVSASKLRALVQARQTVVLWNVDPADYAAASFEEVARWLDARGSCGGDLVLMHDTRPLSAQLVPVIVGCARRRGLRFVGVEEWTR